MKKALLLFLSALMMSTSIHAGEQVSFITTIEDDMPIGHGYGKSPIQPPTVYIDDYTLTFVVDHPDYVLNIKDEDGNVVYSTVVTSSQTTVVLPSALSGDYVIELVMGNWLFTGYIIL